MKDGLRDGGTETVSGVWRFRVYMFSNMVEMTGKGGLIVG